MTPIPLFPSCFINILKKDDVPVISLLGVSFMLSEICGPIAGPVELASHCLPSLLG